MIPRCVMDCNILCTSSCTVPRTSSRPHSVHATVFAIGSVTAAAGEQLMTWAKRRKLRSLLYLGRGQGPVPDSDIGERCSAGVSQVGSSPSATAHRARPAASPAAGLPLSPATLKQGSPCCALTGLEREAPGRYRRAADAGRLPDRVPLPGQPSCRSRGAPPRPNGGSSRHALGADRRP